MPLWWLVGEKNDCLSIKTKDYANNENTFRIVDYYVDHNVSLHSLRKRERYEYPQ
jgi:hypothetical protein